MNQLLAQSYQYVPFVTPLPLWDWWFVFMVPLCAGVAVVYKSAKCGKASDVPREALLVWLWILAAMIGAAVVLAVLVNRVT
jgi:hypothetical protein